METARGSDPDRAARTAGWRRTPPPATRTGRSRCAAGTSTSCSPRSCAGSTRTTCTPPWRARWRRAGRCDRRRGSRCTSPSEALATAVAGELLTRLADAQAAGAVPQIGADRRHHRRRRPPRAGPALRRLRGRLVAGRGLVGRRAVRRARLPRPQRRPARAAFLDAVGADPAKVHEMPSTADAADVAAGAAAYADAVRAARQRRVRRGDARRRPRRPRRLAVPRLPAARRRRPRSRSRVTDSPKPPPERISLTFPALNRARSVWFLVSGDEKADAVARALAEGTDLHDIPAAGVTGSEETIWFLDRACRLPPLTLRSRPSLLTGNAASRRTDPAVLRRLARTADPSLSCHRKVGYDVAQGEPATRVDDQTPLQPRHARVRPVHRRRTCRTPRCANCAARRATVSRSSSRLALLVGGVELLTVVLRPNRASGSARSQAGRRPTPRSLNTHALRLGRRQRSASYQWSRSARLRDGLGPEVGDRSEIGNWMTPRTSTLKRLDLRRAAPRGVRRAAGTGPARASAS